jgi:hypothetical protein
LFVQQTEQFAVIRITTHGHDARVEFPFDDEARLVIRTIPGRRWEPEGRYWVINKALIDLVAKRFTDASFPVTVDGVPWQPPAASSSPPPPRNGSRPPIDAFLCSVPPHLVEPVYKALVKVLHPDHEGDLALMQALNAVHDRLRSR